MVTYDQWYFSNKKAMFDADARAKRKRRSKNDKVTVGAVAYAYRFTSEALYNRK